ncbi:hypothetical protein MNB_SM-3-1374 [hydrothermal vent metagenome]|uniref:Uncharacterized protein n=1 Tax=hydrothermal vent metagenome TaxID=652676 RepID=A0A1W1D1Y7_9ZZZZ
MNIIFRLLFLFGVSTSLFGFGFGGGGGVIGGANDEANDLVNDREFDTWDRWIDDDAPPQEKNENTGDGDSNLSTKIINKSFKLSLGSIKDNWPTDDTYATKDKGGTNTNRDVEITIVDYDDRSKVLSKDPIYWDPTKNGNEHIDSDTITVTKISKRAKVKFYMCADVNNQGKVRIYNLNDCSDTQTQECQFTSDKYFVTCYSSDSFAIRPKEFQVKENKELYISAKDITYEVNATDENKDNVQNYNATSDDYNLTIITHKYIQNSNDFNDSLYGETTLQSYSFSDGASTDTTITYSDIGKIQLQFIDEDFAKIDENDTPYDCSNDDGQNMSYTICSNETNITFIPDHFAFVSGAVHNKNDDNFTYIANDLNMSAYIDATIIAQNADDATVKNFDKDDYINPVSIDFNTSKEDGVIKKIIQDKNLSFEKGELFTKALLFNYTRDTSKAINPFFLDGKDFNITISSTFTKKDADDVTIKDNNGTQQVLDGNATFLYAKTNVPRQIFTKQDTYTVPLFYEVYCYGDDCNTSLLPDKQDSNSTNDPRWFINTKHTAVFGKAKNVSLTHGTGVNVDTQPNGNHQDFMILKLDNDVEFPLKATMQNEANEWLLYNKYDKNTTTNEFEVEFYNSTDDTKWAGVAEENVSATPKIKNSRTNRRTMW